MAQDRIGNGGDVVFCAGQTPEYEVLDLYEARVLRGLLPDLPAATVSENFQLMADRWKVVDSSPATWAQDRYALMPADSLYQEFDLVDVKDSGYVPLKPGCEIRQAAIQNRRIFPQDPIFVFDDRIWQKLDDTNRVVLLFHEAIYEMFLFSGATNSIGARYLNSLIFSNALSKATAKTYFAVWNTSESLPYFRWKEFIFQSEGLKFFANGGIETGDLASNANIRLINQTLSIHGKVGFFEDGAPKVFKLMTNQTLKFISAIGEFLFSGEITMHSPIQVAKGLSPQTSVVINNCSLLLESRPIEFYPSGTPYFFSVAASNDMVLCTPRGNFELQPGAVTLWEDGNASYLNTLQPTLQPCGPLTLEVLGNLQFDEAGNFLRGSLRTEQVLSKPDGTPITVPANKTFDVNEQCQVLNIW